MPSSATEKKSAEPFPEDSCQETSEGDRQRMRRPAAAGPREQHRRHRGLFRERHHADVGGARHRAGAYPRPRRPAAGHLQRAAWDAVDPPPAAARFPPGYLRPGRRPSGAWRDPARRSRWSPPPSWSFLPAPSRGSQTPRRASSGSSARSSGSSAPWANACSQQVTTPRPRQPAWSSSPSAAISS